LSPGRSKGEVEERSKVLVKRLNGLTMPKEILNLQLERRAKNENWGFVIIGGKDQALTVKVGKVGFIRALIYCCSK